MSTELMFKNDFASLEVVRKEINGNTYEAPLLTFTDAGEQKLIDACRIYRNEEMWLGREWIFVSPSQQSYILATRDYLMAIVTKVLFEYKPKIDIWEIQAEIGKEIDPRVFEWIGVMDLFAQMTSAVKNDGQQP